MLKILGFHIRGINAQKEQQPIQNASISTNITFNDIQSELTKSIKNHSIIAISFTFRVEYNSSDKQKKKSGEPLAFVELSGVVPCATTEDEAKKLINDWKDKKISQEIRIPLYNFILAKCSIKALQIQEEINLPPHFPLPSIKEEILKKEETQKKKS